MALQIIWTVDAKDHLNEILEYWHQRNGTRTYSKKLYQTVRNALKINGITHFLKHFRHRLNCNATR